MALGYLFLLFAVMSVLAIIGTVLLFCIKKDKASDVLLVIMTVYSVLITYMNASAQPTNFVGTRILAWMIGLAAVVGLGIRIFTKKQLLISKILVAGAVVVGMYFLYFG